VIRCHLCGKPVDPDHHQTDRAAWGWERRVQFRPSGAKGGSDLLLRQPFDRYAHSSCVDLERAGVNARQQTLV
jgi:hypothetical protein